MSYLLMFSMLVPFCMFCEQYFCLDHYLTEKHIFVVEGHAGERHWKLFNDILTNNPWIHSIGEIGFNAGHSSEIFLRARPDTHVISFDIGVYSSVRKGFAYLSATYPERINLVIGDSKVTVPEFADMNQGKLKFDLIFVDGEHTTEGTFTDIVNMARMAHKDTFLVIDDLDREVVRAAWDRCIDEGYIQKIGYYHDPGTCDRGLAKYNPLKVTP